MPVLKCPACGHRGEVRGEDAFEVRGQMQGTPVRRCRGCGRGLFVRFRLLPPGVRAEVIPDELWTRMQGAWESEFGAEQQHFTGPAALIYAELKTGSTVTPVEALLMAFDKPDEFLALMNEGIAESDAYSELRWTPNGPYFVSITTALFASSGAWSNRLAECLGREVQESNLSSTIIHELTDVFFPEIAVDDDALRSRAHHLATQFVRDAQVVDAEGNAGFALAACVELLQNSVVPPPEDHDHILGATTRSLISNHAVAAREFANELDKMGLVAWSPA